MSETITASLTVSGGDVITAEINTLARGPAGPTGEGGASTWDDITGTASDVPFLPVAAPAHSEGLVFYDSTDKSLTYYNDEADVSMNIGREMWVRVRNNSGAQISNGKVVYINDALGQLPTIRLARADSATTSRVIGIATHDIGNNEFGYVTTTGEVKGLATNAYDDGDLLFLSAVTAGELTLTAPLAPNRVIQVATVLHAHPTQGKLYCHPETDSIPSTGIVDSTATGRSLLTAATQSDARTTGLGSGATGDALFTALTPAAARTTLELGATNTPTFGGLDLLTAATTTLNVYNSLSGADFERLSFRWASNIARIGTAKGGTGTARDLVLDTDGTERVRVLSTGSVGIGTTAPTAALHVVKGATPALTSIFANPAGDVFNQFAALSGTGEYGVWQDALYFQALTSLSNGIRFFIGSTNALQIAAPTGNVGIGTTTPSALLDVNSDTVRVRTARTPASATAAGNAGDICWDANYIYVCTATNTWKRTAISTWP